MDVKDVIYEIETLLDIDLDDWDRGFYSVYDIISAFEDEVRKEYINKIEEVIEELKGL